MIIASNNSTRMHAELKVKADISSQLWHLTDQTNLLYIINGEVNKYWYTHSAQNKGWKLVSHLFKVGRISLASPLKMYSIFCPTKLEFSPKWVTK